MRAGMMDQRWLFRCIAVLLVGVFAVPVAFADVDKVNGLLRRAEANLSGVASSIGHLKSPPTGSKAKLAASRLEQALGDLNPAGELLGKIPGGTDGRAEAVARYTAAAEEYNRLRAILTGSDAPAPAEESNTVRLDYKQEELLKNARFHAREVDGNAAQLTEEIEKLRAVEDQLSINYRAVNGLRSIVENARRKTEFARDALERLPENGAGVAPVRQQLVNADAKVSIASDYLSPLHTELQRIINPANYPEFEVDRRRLRELSIMFRDTSLFQSNRTLAAETVQQAEAAKAECLRIASKYARLMQQQTDQGKAIEGVGNGFLRNHAEFVDEAERQKGALPGEIRQEIATAKQYASEAVEAQKPMWFTGGVPQAMESAADRVSLLTVLDPDAGARMEGELDQAQTEIDRQADSLRELIIRENTMPLDRFEGGDRDKAIETAISAWKVQQPEFELLKARIPSEQWARETKWTYSNGTWYHSDRSRLQVRLMVVDHEDPKLVLDRVVNVWKDHEKGDSMYGTPLRSFDEKPQPREYMLREKVK